MQFSMVEIAAPFQSGANDVCLTNCEFLKVISNPVSDVRSLKKKLLNVLAPLDKFLDSNLEDAHE